MRTEKHEFQTIGELLEVLSPYISARALARICDMSEKYKGGFKKISPKNITMHLLTATKKSISAVKLQCQLGHKTCRRAV